MFVAPFALTLALAAAEAPAAQQKVQVAQAAALRQAIAARAVQKQVARKRPAVMQAPPGGAQIGGGIAIDVPGPGGGLPGTPSTLSAGGAADESVIKAAKVKTSDEGLLDFFRKRTPPAPARDKIAALVKKLASKEATDADAAQGELTAIGHAAVPLLRTAANNVDEAEASSRAKQCLQNIEGAAAGALVTNVARLLATKRPAGATAVLIAYLPYAEDQATFEEVEAALVSVAVVKGKPDPAILKALKDNEAIRRGTAAQVLCTAGGPGNYKHVRPLLKDKSMTVRLRAGLGLVGAFDAEAVPVLIDLLNELPPNLSQQAEDYLTNLAGEWAVTGPKGNDKMSKNLRRGVWLAWWKATDGEELLDEFKSRTCTDAERKKFLALIEKLGDTDAEKREAATTDLINLGKKATPLLRKVIYQNHPRIAPFAVKVLEAIEKDAPNPLPGAAARLLGLRRPEGTAEALLAYVPFCENEETLVELVDILAAVGVSDGKGAEGLLKGLESDVPERRMAAVMALTKGKAEKNLAAIKKALKDKDATVRLRAAQGLVGMEEKAGVPVLIALLKDLPLDQVWEAEDTLGRIAGDKAPTAAVSSTDESRTAAFKAWSTWWDDNGEKVSLRGIEAGQRESGATLVIEQWNQFKGRGRVMEIDAKGKVRWEIGDLNFPYDAQLVKGNRVLVVEQQNRLTERDKSGKVVGNFDKSISDIFHVDRLPNGDTFVACRRQLLILDRKGDEKSKYTYNMNSILGARRERDGSVTFVSYGGNYVKLDRNFKEVKATTLTQVQQWFNYSLTGAAIMPNERVVLSISNFNKVAEIGQDGKFVWEAPITTPGVPQRLANGHILVPGGNNQQTIYEIDRKGKIVKETTLANTRVYGVRRR